MELHGLKKQRPSVVISGIRRAVFRYVGGKGVDPSPLGNGIIGHFNMPHPKTDLSSGRGPTLDINNKYEKRTTNYMHILYTKLQYTVFLSF